VRDIAHIAGHGNGTAALNVMSGSMSLNVRPPIEATRDWALVRLARPACTKGVLPIRVMPIDRILKEAEAKRVFQLSYHRDYTPWKLAYGQPCAVGKSFEQSEWSAIAQDFSDPEVLILHTCDTGGASSGSPILLDTPDGPAVIGINVGTYQQSKVLMQDGEVKKRLKADTIANTGVASAAFAGKLDAFRQAVILASVAEMRELQGLLAQRQLYSGPVDGTYGADLKTAIEAYEKAEGLPVHMNATNIQEAIEPQGGKTVAETIENNLRAVEEQAKKTGTEILVHLNHPNFHYAVTAEDIAQVIRERFVEVYNGHPGVGHLGDKDHASVEEIKRQFMTQEVHLAVGDSNQNSALCATPGFGGINLDIPAIDGQEPLPLAAFTLKS